MIRIKYLITLLFIGILFQTAGCELLGIEPEFAFERTSMHTFEVSNKTDDELILIFYDGYSERFLHAGYTPSYPHTNQTISPGSTLNIELNIIYIDRELWKDPSDYEYIFTPGNDFYYVAESTFTSGSAGLTDADSVRTWNFNGFIYIVEELPYKFNYTASNLASYNYTLTQGKYSDFVLEITEPSASSYLLELVSKKDRVPTPLPETGTILDLNYIEPAAE